MRRAQRASTAEQPRGQIIDGISIRDRPAEVEERAIPGHWEGDLIAGAQNTHIATFVERQSRFTMLVKVPGKDTASVVTALSTQVRQLPSALRRSITWDRGMELAQHKRLTIDTKVQVYFCDPQSPWQRGTNENTNRLLRQHFPKGTDLSRDSQADLNMIALRLNQRPRKSGISDASGYIEGRCCSHRLNLPESISSTEANMSTRAAWIIRSCVTAVLLAWSIPAAPQTISETLFRYDGGELLAFKQGSSKVSGGGGSGAFSVGWNPEGSLKKSGLRGAGMRIMFWGRPVGCAVLAENGGVASDGFELFERAVELTGISPDERRTDMRWTPAGEHPSCSDSARQSRGYSFVHVNESADDRGIGLFTFSGPKFNSSEPVFWQARGELGQAGKGANRFNSGTFVVFRFDWRAGPALVPWGKAAKDPVLLIESRQSAPTLVVESGETRRDRIAQAKQELTLGFINTECMRNRPKRAVCQMKVLFNLAIARSGVTDWSREKWFYDGKVLIDRAQGGIPVIFGPVMKAGDSTYSRNTSAEPELSLWTSLGASTQFSGFQDRKFVVEISFQQFKNGLRFAVSKLLRENVLEVTASDLAERFGERWDSPIAWKLVTLALGQEVHNPNPESRAYIGGGLKELSLAARAD